MREELKLVTREEPITLLDILIGVLLVITNASDKLEDPLDTHPSGEDSGFLPKFLQEYV